MRKAAIAVALAVLVGTVVVAAAVANSSGSAEASQLARCTSVSLGVNAPLTGPAGFLGQEQLSWAEFAVVQYNKANGTRFDVLEGDSQLDAARARTATQRFISTPDVMAIVGPSISQGVVTSARLITKAKLTAISPSATRTSLTTPKRISVNFFRNVPNDAKQAPQVANYVRTELKADNVVAIDSQDDYSVPLANSIAGLLKRKGVKVSRESVAATDTDFSSIVTNISNSTDVVVFATQTASQAQTLSQQLREQGKKAIVFGTDGVYSPSQYKPRTGYVSVFAVDLHFEKSARAVVAAYNKFSGNKTFGGFGPPSYMAAWVAMTAIQRACGDGKVTRGEVRAFVRRSNVPSILGGSVRFDSHGDVVGGKFAIYKVTNGTYAKAN
jgi:branched-chain amino acid transport system substrate-binding protein